MPMRWSRHSHWHLNELRAICGSSVVGPTLRHNFPACWCEISPRLSPSKVETIRASGPRNFNFITVSAICLAELISLQVEWRDLQHPSAQYALVRLVASTSSAGLLCNTSSTRPKKAGSSTPFAAKISAANLAPPGYLEPPDRSHWICAKKVLRSE